jgi:CubicO group peptidase (beta-lactamase class C family)
MTKIVFWSTTIAAQRLGGAKQNGVMTRRYLAFAAGLTRSILPAGAIELDAFGNDLIRHVWSVLPFFSCVPFRVSSKDILKTSRILAVVLFAVELGTVTSPANHNRPAGTSSDLAQLDKIVRAELQETKTPGAAVALVKGDRVIFAKGFGLANVETSAPLTTDMLFHIEWVTKMFTAAALVTLVQEGKLSLDTPIGTYAKGLSPKIAQLIAHELLSQTSGLRDIPGDYGLHEESALGEFSRSLKDDDLLIERGRAFSYSNPGYALAGYLIEQLTGKSYADALNELIFAPLCMARTIVRPTVAMTYPLAMATF